MVDEDNLGFARISEAVMKHSFLWRNSALSSDSTEVPFYVSLILTPLINQFYVLIRLIIFALEPEGRRFCPPAWHLGLITLLKAILFTHVNFGARYWTLSLLCFKNQNERKNKLLLPPTPHKPTKQTKKHPTVILLFYWTLNKNSGRLFKLFVCSAVLQRG